MTDRFITAALSLPFAPLLTASAGGTAYRPEAGAPQAGAARPVPGGPAPVHLREVLSQGRLGPDPSLAEIILADGVRATVLTEPNRGDAWPSLHPMPHRAPDGDGPGDLAEALRAGAALRDAIGEDLRAALAAHAAGSRRRRSLPHR